MTADESADLHVSLVEERISIEKRVIETDRVRIRTEVDLYDAPVETSVRRGQVDVQRIAVDREVSEAPASYHDGDTLVIPIVEERLVIEKRLFVVEEVRVTRSSRDEALSTSVPLRRVRAAVERAEPDPITTGTD